MSKTDDFFADWTALLDKLQQSGLKHETIWVFRTLLAAARSRNDLRRLHDEVVEPDLRLCRQDYIMLEEFWVKHVKGQNAEGREPLTHTPAFFLLNHQVYKGSMDRYYAQLLQNAAGRVYTSEGEFTYNGEDWRIIYSRPERSGHGSSHYFARLFGKRLGLACWLKPGSTLRVAFEVHGVDLTEELTHHLVADMPKFDLAETGFSTDKGLHLRLVYDLDPAGLAEHLEQGPPSYVGGPPIPIGTHRFLSFLAERLLSMRIPLTAAMQIE